MFSDTVQLKLMSEERTHFSVFEKVIRIFCFPLRNIVLYPHISCTSTQLFSNFTARTASQISEGYSEINAQFALAYIMDNVNT